MGCVLKLVRMTDLGVDVDSIDLVSTSIELAADGYMPGVADLYAPSVIETITLKISGTSKDNLAAIVQTIDAKIKQVQWWLDAPKVERYQVWIRAQLTNETYPRQAQLLNIHPPTSFKIYNPAEINSNYIGEYILGIERTPFWEDSYPFPTTTSKTGINSIGGTVVLSETINGDVPARLARLDCSASATIYDHFWLGWRTSRFGTTANFVPVWSLKDGTVGTDTTTAADGSAYSGTKMRCAFGSDATLIQRCYIMVSNVSASHPDDQRGNFTVLLRAKMSDTSVARVRMRAGYFDAVSSSIHSPVTRSRVVISGTDWNYYELGAIGMPPFRFFNSVVSLVNFTIALDAERVSGSGALDLDVLVMIPTDEGMVKIVGASTITSFTTLTHTVISPANFEHYGLMIINQFGSNTYDNASLSQIGWSLPANGEAPRLIAAASGNNISAKSTTFDLAYTYIPRWRTLRGNST